MNFKKYQKFGRQLPLACMIHKNGAVSRFSVRIDKTIRMWKNEETENRRKGIKQVNLDYLCIIQVDK
ncbi:MAG: hypothetical protein PHQ25_00260 [Acidobacteriota bacterium]|nr:hypothetical protein [Acidobacteriota bacterium]